MQTAIEVLAGNMSAIKLRTEIRDPEGNVVASAEDTATLKEKHVFEQDVRIPGPHLWGVDDPYLYKAISSVWCDDTLNEMGCNAVRTSHNPPGPVVIKAESAGLQSAEGKIECTGP